MNLAERLEEEEPARAEPLVVPRPPRRVGPARRREILRRGVAAQEEDDSGINVTCWTVELMSLLCAVFSDIK